MIEQENAERIVMLGHTGCGAVETAGEERDPTRVCRLNVRHGVERIRREFRQHPEIGEIAAKGAVYDIRSGEVEWLEE